MSPELIDPELIDMARLRENVEGTARRLRAEPRHGVVRPWVSTRLERDVRAVARFEQYGDAYELRCDESAGRAGTGSAPSPMRYLLSGVAFCLQVWCAKAAALAGVHVHDLQIDVRTLLDMRGEHRVGDVPAHPQWFVLDVRVQSPAAAADVIGIVRDAARRCPVIALVAQAVPVHLLVAHNGSTVLDERPAQLRHEHEEISSV
ncbi:MAG: OsmC-related (seleno)protein [Pseudonocardia sp.]